MAVAVGVISLLAKNRQPNTIAGVLRPRGKKGQTLRV
jgi:hypothetical protein